MDRSREQRSSRRSTSAAASMAALAAAAAAGEGADSAGEVTHVDEDQSQPTTLGGAAAGGAPVVSSLSSPPPPTEAVPVTAARRGGGAAGGGYGGPSCQADRCGVDLTDAKRYHRRHKVCETHSRAPVVIVAGLRQRFCQQCSRFQDLSEFDENRRSCRRRLAGHNERRRKGAMDPHPGDQDGRGHPHPGNNLLIT